MLLFFLCSYEIERALAEIDPPERKYLFLEDKYKKKTAKEKKKDLQSRRKDAQSMLSGGSALPFDVNATSIYFDSSGNVINADGDVIITYATIVAEANHGKVDIQSNKAELTGDVRFSDVTANITADSARLDLNEGSGELINADIFFVEGDYELLAKQATREEGDSYVLNDVLLSTCQCPDASDCKPWRLRAGRARITRNGYGQAWDASLEVQDVPVFYFPYLFFPAKNQRQSGLLPASFGLGRRSGADLNVPFFWAIDQSSDLTVQGLYESRVRVGADTEYRRVFSRNNELDMGLIYFNESARGDRLLGTNVDGIYDKTWDVNRFGGYVNHSWKIPTESSYVQYILDGRLVSDDLFVREYENDKIASYNDRYVTSTAVLRSPLGESYSLDLSGEYNQSLVSNDALVFQRAPELNVTGLNSFQPFGENPLGLKLVTQTNLSSIYFTRQDGYDGARSELYERFRFPFHYRNYLEGSFEANARASEYNLNDTHLAQENSDGSVVELDETLPSSSSRVVPGFSSKVGTTVEKVFDLADDSVLKRIGELGTVGRESQLDRVKHSIEPYVKHLYVPYVDQDENPQFDSYDHLAQRNVVTYGVTQRLYGKYNPRNPYLYGIEETTPELRDLGSIKTNTPIDQRFTFGFDDETAVDSFYTARQGSIEELATLKVYQSYDILQENSDSEDSDSPFSDIGTDLSLYPNQHVALGAGADYNQDTNEFDTYTLEGQLSSKRGDSLRNRFRFVNNNISQLESSLEIRLTEYVKLGYYSRFDDMSGTFIEQRGGFRFSSPCNCWLLDVTVADKVNPNETKIFFNLTLMGLGDIGTNIYRTTSTN